MARRVNDTWLFCAECDSLVVRTPGKFAVCPHRHGKLRQLSRYEWKRRAALVASVRRAEYLATLPVAVKEEKRLGLVEREQARKEHGAHVYRVYLRHTFVIEGMAGRWVKLQKNGDVIECFGKVAIGKGRWRVHRFVKL